MLNLVLFGPPGAGKGTQSQKLIDHYQLTHISTGDLFRKHLGEGTPLGVRARTFMDVGKLVPDDLVIDMVDDRLGEQDDKKGIIFDGFPRTIPQAEALDKFLRTYDSHIAGMIALSVPTEELVKRLLLRGQTSGRADDQNEEKIATRLEVYRQETLPVARYYQDRNKYAEVNGVGEIDDIFREITEAVEGFKANS
jgi:adenylate kinase